MSERLSLYSKAAKLSLENAEQWVEDAKLLLEHESFGHANALIRLAVEEGVKALVCWFVSERIFPAENMMFRDVFRHHRVKNEFFLGFLGGWIAQIRFRSWDRLMAGVKKQSEKQVSMTPEDFREMIARTDIMRQRAMYVNLKGKKVETPLDIKAEESKSILMPAVFFLKIVRLIFEELPEGNKAELREIFSLIPNEAWETGELTPQRQIDWLRKAIRRTSKSS